MSAPSHIPRLGYGVVLADPPWKFVTFTDAVSPKSPDAQYRCLSLDDIAAKWQLLDLDRAVGRDCVLALWFTWPVLDQARWLLSAWGFRYKTGGCWAKVTAEGKPALGTGYIYRGASEAWMIGTRGAPRVRSRSERNLIMEEDLIVAARREHSRKPPVMQDSLERLFAGPYLELFARTKRPGWEAWGNQIEKFAGAA
jgi:N6-adenosine-specific RNA methylase IME4